MRLAWFTPLPPMASGIADYSMEILPLVAERAEVELFCPRPGRFRRLRHPSSMRVRDPEEYFASPDGYDACLYHLGNNPFHEFVYEAALRRPGIAVFHDADLHHLIAFITVEGIADRARYQRVLEEEYGERGDRLGALRLRGVATDLEKFLFPLTSHVARRSLGIAVHSEDSARRIGEGAPDVPLAVIPHHAGAPPRALVAVAREEARRRLGIPENGFVVGHFGFVTKPKQPAAVIGGFARLHEEFPDALLYVVGADRSGGALARMIAARGLTGAVRITGFVDLERFYLYLKAADVVINLRYPTAGESSGTLARSLAEGRAVIVNNYGSWAELPGNAVLKVEIDGRQSDQVGEHLVRLAGDPGFRRGVEERARGYARRVLDPARCADLYVRFAEEVASRARTG